MFSFLSNEYISKKSQEFATFLVCPVLVALAEILDLVTFSWLFQPYFQVPTCNNFNNAKKIIS